MDYAKKSSYSFFDYNITEKFLPIKYTGDFSLVSRNGIDLENTTIKNPEIFPCVISEGGKKILNPIFTFDRNTVRMGEGNLSDYINTYGLELLYDVQFGYDGCAFEIIYRYPRDLQLWVDEGDGWKIVIDRYRINAGGDEPTALRVAFEEESQQCESGSYKMRRFRIRTNGWFGGIIGDRTCTVVKTINRKAPLAVFEGSSITESCNGVSDFNGYSYARILSDIFGFDYLCLAQGGTGISKPFNDRPSMLQRIDGVLRANPDILFIEVGINDDANAELKKCTEEYLKTIREKLPETFVVMIGCYQPKYVPETPKQRCYKDVITSEIAKKYGVPFIELTTGYIYGVSGEIIAQMGAPLVTGNGTAFEPNGSGNSDRYTGKINVKDGCHPNPIAYKMYAEYIRSAFIAIVNFMDC